MARKRKFGLRERNGRISRRDAQSPINAGLLVQRAASLGLEGRDVAVDYATWAQKIGGDAGDLDPARTHVAFLAAQRRLLDARLGDPVGVLLLHGTITHRQHDAALQYRAIWSRWAEMAGARARYPVCRDPANGSDTDPDAWHRVCRQMQAIRACVRETVNAPALAATLLESLLMEFLMPPRLDPRAHEWHLGIASLRNALNNVADHLRIPVPQEAA